ncbi:MAG: oligosaccharide flippase family protein [Halioglobus sp.]|nr:oligosaccharide flippase family protein [Halioglobus sp.]
MGIAVALALGIRLLEMAGEFGIDRMLVQVEDSTLPAIRNVIHTLQLLKGGVVALIMALICVPFSHVLNPSISPMVLFIASVSLVFRGAANYDYRERQRNADFGPALLVEGGSNVAATLAAAPLAWALRDYTVLAWVSLLQAAIFCVASHLVARHPYRLGFNRILLKRCLRYGAPVALNGILMFFAFQGDRLVVMLHFSSSDLARFALAAQLTLLPALMGTRYLLASELPRFGHIIRNSESLIPVFRLLLLRVLVVAIILVCVLGLTGSQLVVWLYGSAYQLPTEIFWLLGAGAAVRLVKAVPGTVLLALESTHLLLLSNLPRLLMLPVALWLAAIGNPLSLIVAVGVLGEALSLGFALLAVHRNKTHSEISVEAPQAVQVI